MENMTLENNFKDQTNNTSYFTYHKKSGYIGFIVAMLVVSMIETVGVSFLLYSRFPILHWLHLVLSMSLMVVLIIDLRAVIKNPIVVKGDELSLKIGIRPRVNIDIKNIKEINNGSLHYEKFKKDKNVLDISLLGFDEPTFEIVLTAPINQKKLIGKAKGEYSRIFFTVDEKEKLGRCLSPPEVCRFEIDNIRGVTGTD